MLLKISIKSSSCGLTPLPPPHHHLEFLVIEKYIFHWALRDHSKLSSWPGVKPEFKSERWRAELSCPWKRKGADGPLRWLFLSLLDATRNHAMILLSLILIQGPARMCGIIFPLSYPSAIRDTVLTGCTTPEWRQTETRRGCGTAVISLNPGRTLPRATLVALLGATCSLRTFSKRDHGCPLCDLIPPHFWRLHPLFERCCHPGSLCWFEKCPHWVTYLNSCSPVDGAV